MEEMDEKGPLVREDFRDQKVTLVGREALDPRDLLDLKEKRDKKYRGCQASVTTTGDERIALEMLL